jgi:hypothetical protein
MRLFWPTVDMLLETSAWTPPDGVALSPSWFRPLGHFPRRQAPILLDTDTLEVTGGASGVVYPQGEYAPDIAVFCFLGGEIAGEVIVRGARPAAILFAGDVSITAYVDARGAGARAGGPGLGGYPGGGGGFGAAGGASAPAAGGSSYGPNRVFEIGSGGQSGSSCGGLGGGGLQIGASGCLTVRGGWLRVDGFDGRPVCAGTAGGGGSGGSLVLHGREVGLDRATCLSTRGGAGGEGRGDANGGGGGAGGFILGLTAGSGIFDPGGAEVRPEGGAGGGARAPAASGAPGGCGVTFLAGKRPRAPRTLRFVGGLRRPSLAWAAMRAG